MTQQSHTAQRKSKNYTLSPQDPTPNSESPFHRNITEFMRWSQKRNETKFTGHKRTGREIPELVFNPCPQHGGSKKPTHENQMPSPSSLPHPSRGSEPAANVRLVEELNKSTHTFHSTYSDDQLKPKKWRLLLLRTLETGNKSWSSSCLARTRPWVQVPLQQANLQAFSTLSNYFLVY